MAWDAGIPHLSRDLDGRGLITSNPDTHTVAVGPTRVGKTFGWVSAESVELFEGLPCAR